MMMIWNVSEAFLIYGLFATVMENPDGTGFLNGLMSILVAGCFKLSSRIFSPSFISSVMWAVFSKPIVYSACDDFVLRYQLVQNYSPSRNTFPLVICIVWACVSKTVWRQFYVWILLLLLFVNDYIVDVFVVIIHRRRRDALAKRDASVQPPPPSLKEMAMLLQDPWVHMAPGSGNQDGEEATLGAHPEITFCGISAISQLVMFTFAMECAFLTTISGPILADTMLTRGS